jgi:hypothetical protein
MVFPVWLMISLPRTAPYREFGLLLNVNLEAGRTFAPKSSVLSSHFRRYVGIEMAWGRACVAAANSC